MSSTPILERPVFIQRIFLFVPTTSLQTKVFSLAPIFRLANVMSIWRDVMFSYGTFEIMLEEKTLRKQDSASLLAKTATSTLHFLNLFSKTCDFDRQKDFLMTTFMIRHCLTKAKISPNTNFLSGMNSRSCIPYYDRELVQKQDGGFVDVELTGNKVVTYYKNVHRQKPTSEANSSAKQLPEDSPPPIHLNSIKLIPTGSHMRHCCCVAFSPDDEILGLGMNQSRVSLVRTCAWDEYSSISLRINDEMVHAEILGIAFHPAQQFLNRREKILYCISGRYLFAINVSAEYFKTYQRQVNLDTLCMMEQKMETSNNTNNTTATSSSFSETRRLVHHQMLPEQGKCYQFKISPSTSENQQDFFLAISRHSGVIHVLDVSLKPNSENGMHYMKPQLLHTIRNYASQNSVGSLIQPWTFCFGSRNCKMSRILGEKSRSVDNDEDNIQLPVLYATSPSISKLCCFDARSGAELEKPTDIQIEKESEAERFSKSILAKYGTNAPAFGMKMDISDDFRFIAVTVTGKLVRIFDLETCFASFSSSSSTTADQDPASHHEFPLINKKYISSSTQELDQKYETTRKQGDNVYFGFNNLQTGLGFQAGITSLRFVPRESRFKNSDATNYYSTNHNCHHHHNPRDAPHYVCFTVESGQVFVYDCLSFQKVLELTASPHQLLSNDFSFSSCGKFMALPCNSGHVKVNSVLRGKEMKTTYLPENESGLFFKKDQDQDQQKADEVCVHLVSGEDFIIGV